MKSSFVLLGMASAQLDSIGLLQLRALANLSIREHDQATDGCEALVAPGFKFGVKVFPAGSSSSVDQCVHFSSTAAITEAVGVARKASLNENFAVINAKSSLSSVQLAVKGNQDLVTEAQANADMLNDRDGESIKGQNRRFDIDIQQSSSDKKSLDD